MPQALATPAGHHCISLVSILCPSLSGSVPWENAVAFCPAPLKDDHCHLTPLSFTDLTQRGAPKGL